MTWQHFDGSPCEDTRPRLPEVSMTNPSRGRKTLHGTTGFSVCQDGRLVREVL
jgi:hypothetical protein